MAAAKGWAAGPQRPLCGSQGTIRTLSESTKTECRNRYVGLKSNGNRYTVRPSVDSRGTAVTRHGAARRRSTSRRGAARRAPAPRPAHRRGGPARPRRRSWPRKASAVDVELVVIGVGMWGDRSLSRPISEVPATGRRRAAARWRGPREPRRGRGCAGVGPAAVDARPAHGHAAPRPAAKRRWGCGASAAGLRGRRRCRTSTGRGRR